MNISVKNEEEFNLLLASGRPLAALFYSAWCPYCVDFLPVFERRAAAGTGTFVAVLIDEMSALGEKYSVEVFPTVIFFNQGGISRRLDGIEGEGLTESGLAEFLRSCGLP